jgi:hypothetical protein
MREKGRVKDWNGKMEKIYFFSPKDHDDVTLFELTLFQ